MKKPHPEWIENSLFWATVVWAVISFFVGLIVVLVILFAADHMGGPEQRARSYTPVLGFFLAALTFLTVLWRGTINSRQADEDRRQNDSKEEADLALLLEKAHGLLGSVTSAALHDNKEATLQKRTLALALLETIATAKSDKYAVFALQATIDQIVPIYMNSGSTFHRHFDQVRQIFDRAAKRNRTLPKLTRLDFDPENKKDFRVTKHNGFQLFPSLPAVFVTGAIVRLDPAACRVIDEKNDWTFRYCRIVTVSPETPGSRVNCFDSVRFFECEIYQANVGVIGSMLARGSDYKVQKYVGCNLSDTLIFGAGELKEREFEHCFYYEDMPPKFHGNQSAVDYIVANKLDIKPIPRVQSQYLKKLDTHHHRSLSKSTGVV